MTQRAVPHTRPAPQRRPGVRDGFGWLVPVAVALSEIPVVAGSLRRLDIADGRQLLPTSPRADASPATPPVVQVVAAALYAFFGACQFSAPLRRRHLAGKR